MSSSIDKAFKLVKSNKNSSTSQEYRGMLDLPRELRDNIYDIVINDRSQQNKAEYVPLPCIHVHECLPERINNLLRVNHQIHDEVEQRYYANVFSRIVLDWDKVKDMNTIGSMKKINRLTNILVPLRNDWDKIQKLDVTITMKHKDPRDRTYSRSSPTDFRDCGFCLARGEPQYPRNLAPRADDEHDSKRYQNYLFVPNLKELNIRFTTTGIDDDIKSEFNVLRNIIGRFAALGSPDLKVQPIDCWVGRGLGASDALWDYTCSLPWRIIYNKYPSGIHIKVSRYVLHGKLQGWIDQGLSFGQIEEQLWSGREGLIRQKYPEIYKRGEIPTGMDGWIMPHTGKAINPTALHIWGIGKWEDHGLDEVVEGVLELRKNSGW